MRIILLTTQKALVCNSLHEIHLKSSPVVEKFGRGSGVGPVKRGSDRCRHDYTPQGYISGPPCADYAVIWNNPNSQHRNSPLPGNMDLHLPPTTCSHVK